MYRRYDIVDKYSRKRVKKHYSYVENLDLNSIIDLIDNVTGGLGYTSSEPLDVARMGIAGSYIAWPERVTNNSKVLEIGTGIGRTAYVVHYVARPKLYLTIDISGEILYVALYKNPVKIYQNVLWLPDVKIVFGDAVELIGCIKDYFDHIIHDGGPNPRRNQRLYSQEFLEALIRLLKPKASLSVFIGSERKMQEYIYDTLVELGLEIVETVPLPFSKARVVHAYKP